MTTKPVDRNWLYWPPVGFCSRKEGFAERACGLLDWSSLISDAIQVIHTGSVTIGAGRFCRPRFTGIMNRSELIERVLQIEVGERLCCTPLGFCSADFTWFAQSAKTS